MCQYVFHAKLDLTMPSDYGIFLIVLKNNTPDYEAYNLMRIRSVMKKLTALLITAVLAVATVAFALILSEVKGVTEQPDTPVLNEFMASNQGTLHDEDGDASDWIEISNPTSEPINLQGYALSDNRRNEPWVFPEVIIPPRGHIIVWASGKNIAESGHKVIVLNGGGRDIWDVSDSFYFDYVKMDKKEFSIIARAAYIEHTHPWAKAGVMIRTGLDASSSHVSMFVTPANGFAFQRRVLSAHSSEHTPGGIPLVFPDGWVKLTIKNSLLEGVSEVTGYASNDGVTWHLAGTEYLIGTDIGLYAGLAVTSQNPGNLAEARFTDVSIDGIKDWTDTSMQMNIGTRDRGNTKAEDYNVLHTDFRLRESGEIISLFNPQGDLIDGLTFSQQTVGYSFGRIDGRDEWAYFAKPTPGGRNITQFANGITEMPNLSIRSGFYKYSIEVFITTQNNARIYYTLDGSTPDVRSMLYEEPLKIDNTSILRAIAVSPGLHPSLPVTATYIIGENYGLPVLSIVTDPENLWDESKGIIHNAWQRGEEWERPAAVSLIRSDATVFDFEQDIGLRVHGGASRWVDKKSFRLYWRGGTHLEYPLLPNKPEITRFRRLVVRSGGNDQATGWDGNLTWVMMRCWLQGELWRQAGGNASSHLSVILLLNGEMWGMYNIRERIDRFFLQENFGIDPNNVDLIKYEHPGRATVQEGSLDEWNSLNEFFENADLTDPDVYRQAHELIDVQNFTDYTIMQIYAGNWDWPQNNVYAFRERTAGAKWQWILWDIDDAFMMRSPINHNTLQWGTRDRARRDLAPPWYAEAGATTLHTTLMLRKLLENAEYREFFTGRAKHLLDTVLHPENVIQEIEEGARMMEAGVKWETLRWGTTVEQWHNNIARIKEFARLRPNILRIHFINYFNLDEESFPIIEE